MKKSLPRILSCVLVAAGLSLIASNLAAGTANSSVAATRLADKLPALPVTTSFEKGAAADTGALVVLKVTNTSSGKLKVVAAIAESVKSHSKPKNRNEDHTIAAGKSWSIKDLAHADHVVLTAEGYAPLEVTVP